MDALGGAHACLYRLNWEGKACNWGTTLKLWREHAGFRRQFLTLWRECPLLRLFAGKPRR